MATLTEKFLLGTLPADAVLLAYTVRVTQLFDDSLSPGASVAGQLQVYDGISVYDNLVLIPLPLSSSGFGVVAVYQQFFDPSAIAGTTIAAGREIYLDVLADTNLEDLDEGSATITVHYVGGA